MLKIFLLLSISLVSCTSTKEVETVRPYPLDTCVVMESKLGSMGDPVVRVYKGQEVKFCCEPCVEEFEAEPEFYLKKMGLK